MTTYLLPFPVSTNNLFINAGRKRVLSLEYRAWKKEAAQMLMMQRAKPFPTPCTITINLDDTRRGDCSNRSKAVEDALVEYGVIPDDSKKHVRRISVGWEPLHGCSVSLEAA